MTNMSKCYCVKASWRENGKTEICNHYYADERTAQRAREVMIRMNNCKKSAKAPDWNNNLHATKRNLLSYNCYDFKTNGLKKITIRVGNVTVGPVEEIETTLCI